VKYSDATQQFDLYHIESGSAKPNGRIVKRVYYNDANGNISGGFAQNATGWVEFRMPTRQAAFNFIEVNRDDWSVYLEDRSRSVAIQIDMHTGKVMYNQFGQPRQPLYNIALQAR
jgi:hypothetical protein